MRNHDPIFVALGRMLVHFQSLEATLRNGLTLLLHDGKNTPHDRLISAYLSELSFGSLSRLTSLLPSQFTSESIATETVIGRERLDAELNDCQNKLYQGLKLANEAEQRRNQLIHSTWLIGDGLEQSQGTLYRSKIKIKAQKLSIQFEQETIATINENTEKAKEAQSLLHIALMDYRLISNFKW